MIELLTEHINRLYPYAIAPFFCGLIILVNSINFFVREYKSTFGRHFFFLCLGTSAWTLGGALIISAPSLNYAVWYSFLYWIGWFAIPILFLNLVIGLVSKKNIAVIIVLIAYCFIGLYAIHSETVFLIKKYDFGFYPHITSPANYILGIPYILICMYGMVRLFAEYYNTENHTRRRFLKLLWIGSSAGFTVSITELFTLASVRTLPADHAVRLSSYLMNYGIFTVLIASYLLLLISLKKNLWMKIPFFRTSSYIKIFCIVIGPQSALGMYVFTNYCYPLYPVSSFGIIVTTFFFSYTILKYRLIDVSEIAKEILVYTLLAAVFIIIFTAIGALLDYAFDIIPMLIFMLFVFFFFNPINLRIQRLVTRKIFHHTYDYQKTIRENSRKLVTILDYKALLQQIQDTIIKAIESSTFTLLIFNYDNDSYQVEIAHGVSVDEKISFTVHEHTIKFLMLVGHEVFRDQIDKKEYDNGSDDLIPFFDLFKAELLIPMIYKNVMRGIMCLGKKESGQMYYRRDLELLQVLANQAVIAIDNARLYEIAIKDELTDLYIIRFFKQRILEEINHSARLNQEFSLLMIDIDFFKSVNDTHGHQAGDQVLKEIASTIRAEVRAIDIVSRYGGEEFAVILPRANNQTAVVIAERIRENVEKKIFSSGIQRTVSVGIATAIVERLTDFNKKMQAMPIKARQDVFGLFRENIIRHADEALYEAKNAGRNVVKNKGILKLEIP